MEPEEFVTRLPALLQELDRLSLMPRPAVEWPLRPGYSLYRYNAFMERWDMLGTTREADTLAHPDWAAVRIPLVQHPASAPQEWCAGELWDATGPVHSGIFVAAAAVDTWALQQGP